MEIKSDAGTLTWAATSGIGRIGIATSGLASSTFPATYSSDITAPNGTISIYGDDGTGPSYAIAQPSLDEDALAKKILDKLYGAHSLRVITTCRYCHAANAYDNPTCVRCGAPMGAT